MATSAASSLITSGQLVPHFAFLLALLTLLRAKREQTASVLYLQGEVVEAHGPQGESSGQQTHVREHDPDGVLEAGQFLEDGGRLDQLPVRLRLLDLGGEGENTGGLVVKKESVNQV